MSRSFPSSWHNPEKLRRAFGDPPKQARIFTRYPCDFAGSLWTGDGKTRLGPVRVVNIGMGGAYLRGLLEIEKNTLYLLQIVRGSAQLILAGRIVRREKEKSGEGALHLGFSFALTAEQERRLKSGLEKMRQARAKAPGADDSRLKWYWGV